MSRRADTFMLGNWKIWVTMQIDTAISRGEALAQTRWHALGSVIALTLMDWSMAKYSGSPSSC